MKTNKPVIDGPALRARRERLGLTQLELGKILSVAPLTISRWELAAMGIAHPTILLLALTAIENQSLNVR
jgi:transcriptional regulator with XRE-family HTH domain